jgi:hypothetical protein
MAEVDLSGIWVADTPRYLINLAGGGTEVPFQPWAGVPKLDTLPYPFTIFTTEALHATERFQRTDFGHYEDSGHHRRSKGVHQPWSNTIPLHLLVDTELLELVSEDNRSLPHMQNKQ